MASADQPQGPPSAAAKVELLSSVFPQLEGAVLESLLLVHRGDVHAAIHELLAIHERPCGPCPPHPSEQADADLARQLAYELNQPSLPYQPRIRKSPGRAPVQRSEQPCPEDDGHPAKDELQKITEELGKLAESGKKTMTSWLNKAKAKMQEIQLTNQFTMNSPSEADAAHISPSAVSPSSANPLAVPRSSRWSPALPHASRYHSPPANNDNSIRQFGMSEKGDAGYHVGPLPDEPPPNKSMSGSTGTTPSHEPKLGRLEASQPVELEQVGDLKPGSPPNLTGTRNPPGSSPALGLTGAAELGKTMDDDEESLEYTRNPFEDDD